jgi:hypothetical protein
VPQSDQKNSSSHDDANHKWRKKKKSLIAHIDLDSDVFFGFTFRHDVVKKNYDKIMEMR